MDINRLYELSKSGHAKAVTKKDVVTITWAEQRSEQVSQEAWSEAEKHADGELARLKEERDFVKEQLDALDERIKEYRGTAKK